MCGLLIFKPPVCQVSAAGMRPRTCLAFIPAIVIKQRVLPPSRVDGGRSGVQSFGSFALGGTLLMSLSSRWRRSGAPHDGRVSQPCSHFSS